MEPISLSPKQLELLNWLRENAPSLAASYEGAVKLLEDRSFPCRVHFISHAIRDIADRLVYVLDPRLESSRVQYENELDRISEGWPVLNDLQDTNRSDDLNSDISIPYELAVRIDSLVKSHIERRNRPSSYDLLFQYLMKNEPRKGLSHERIAREFKKVRGWFMERTHLRKEGLEFDEEELRAQFMRFEGILYSFVGDFFTVKVEIDEILRRANG